MSYNPTRRMKLGAVVSNQEDTDTGLVRRHAHVRDLTRAAEEVGFDSVWLPDHFLFRTSDQAEGGQWEMFTQLAALAESTSRIALGSFVAAIPFRSPALLAKMADSLDEISDGRFILGLGAGWNELEFTAFGFPFDHLVPRFEEGLEIILPLLREGHVDYEGAYYSARDSVLRPRGPTPGGPPIWIGAKRPRMMRLVAQHAAAWSSVWHKSADEMPEARARLETACAEVGRDPKEIIFSAGTFTKLLAPNEKPPEEYSGKAGDVDDIVEFLRAFDEQGVRHITLIIENQDRATIERYGEVIRRLDTLG